jgi:Secretion system C-terminal sorting domain
MMKNIVVTLMLIFMIVPQLFAVTGTVTLSYENGTVSYNDTQTFYEFDVLGYIASGSGTNTFREGQIYVEYNTTVFDDSTSLNIVSTTLMGPLATDGGLLYGLSNNGVNTAPDAFSITFEASLLYDSPFYDADTYISTSSGSPSTLMHIKLEVIASGSSDIDWPVDIPDINTLFREYDSASGSIYDGLSITNANETTSIVYSNTGDPALPITLKEFAAQYVDAGVALSWVTESEVQNLGFVLKRAIIYSEDDLSSYEVIASYQTDDELYGAGTTTEQNTYTYIDNNVKPGVSYSYILEDVDYDGNVVAHDPISIVITENVLYENEEFSLGSNYPNPFNPSFTIPFELTKAMDVSIKMYDITGKQVMSILDGTFEARQYQFRVNASDLNSGIYFVRTIIGSEVITQKMSLLK